MLATLFTRRTPPYWLLALANLSEHSVQDLSFQTWMIESAASYDLQGGRANEGWQCLGIQLSELSDFKFRVSA
jgi:hypothetical protein